jgi:hypothetical protein
MPSQDPLLTQLAERCRTFSAGTGISLNRMAAIVGVEKTNFSAFVNGRVGLSAKSTIKLLQLLNLTKREVEMKLAKRAVHIEHFQESGQPMRLSDDGWVAQEDGGGGDHGTTSTTGTNANPARSVPDAEELEFLAGLAGLHQAIIDKINARQVAKARVNTGPTESVRRATDNADSSRPGPRQPKFSRK